MPIKIYCPDCKGTGLEKIVDGREYSCPHCKNGKIKVYTEEELNQKLGYIEGLYTPEELQKAVKRVREEIIEWLKIEKLGYENDYEETKNIFAAGVALGLQKSIEAIRAIGE